MKGYSKKTGKPIFQTHGMSNTRFWVIFMSMQQRCKDINSKEYKRYGGRGIKILWESFEEFKKDMYKSYLIHCKVYGEKQTTIDRIDVNGDYNKDNCRWATPKIQANNRTSNKFIEFNGKKQTYQQWTDELGVDVRKRLWRGWTFEQIYNTPKRNWPLPKNKVPVHTG